MSVPTNPQQTKPSFMGTDTPGRLDVEFTMESPDFLPGGGPEHMIIGLDPIPDSIVPCFAAGTLIAGPEGERRVEDLAIGDPVTTADGRSVAVKWIGRTTVSPRFRPAERLDPVRIRAGAFGDGVPACDLMVTADHGMVLDGMVINAGALVNGTSVQRIDWRCLGDSLTYYHVETEAHDVIQANGAAAETYVDYVARTSFDNFAEYLALYGQETAVAELAMPRISAARLVPEALRARLAAGDRQTA